MIVQAAHSLLRYYQVYISACSARFHLRYYQVHMNACSARLHLQSCEFIICSSPSLQRQTIFTCSLLFTSFQGLFRFFADWLRYKGKGVARTCLELSKISDGGIHEKVGVVQLDAHVARNLHAVWETKQDSWITTALRVLVDRVI